MGGKVNQFIDGAAPDGGPIMPKQVHQQRNGGRTKPLDDFKSFPMQAFIATVEESSQQRERTSRPLDQGGFGCGADLRVLGQQATFPVNDQGGVSGKTRLRRKRRLLGRSGGLKCGIARTKQEQSYDEWEGTVLGDQMLEFYPPHDAMPVPLHQSAAPPSAWKTRCAI